jgi:hypothetical protein
VLLGEDETVRRLFPVLRRAWALRGAQAHSAMTGCNAKRVLLGAINRRTGHRIILRRPHMEPAHLQACLRLVREAYPGRRIALLLDEAPSHRAAKSQSLAADLDLELSWLPKPCAE